MVSRHTRGMIQFMPDGTEKQINPFTGTEVWFIPERKNRPIFTHKAVKTEKIDKKEPEDYCNFCPAQYFSTPPEKARVLAQDGHYTFHDRVNPDDIFSSHAEFRRIPNLFEIVTINYWKRNFSYRLSKLNRNWKERYLSTDLGRNHVISVINMKLKYAGQSEDDIKSIMPSEKFEMADAFFGGGHELIVAKRHYVEHAEYTSQLSSSGELSIEEHFQYFDFTLKAIRDIYENNRYVRYVAVYQNWLEQAGASFDHLHKQLVALDEWGVSLEREVDKAYKQPNIYNEAAANYASYNNFVICENDFAMAFVDIGHRHPTIAIFSKSSNCHPDEHTGEELRGFSDVVHAVHKATGSQISCNEEWYYMPRDCTVAIPWHIMIKWRINIAAGFEGGTKIYVNSMSLQELRDTLVPRLFELRTNGEIAWMNIAEECPVKPNSLKYYKRGIS